MVISRHFRFLVFPLITGIALGAASSSFAQGGPEPSRTDAGMAVDLDTAGETVVVGKPMAQEENPSRFVSVLDTTDNEERFISLAEVLDRSPGIHVERLGGLGSFGSLYLRGIPSNGVPIYLDGIPLNDARSGVVNLEDIPLDQVRMVEIYRGITPPGLPQSGLGGAVNLVTRLPKTGATWSASSGVGSWGTTQASVTHGASMKEGDYLLHLKRTSTQGNFEFTSDNGTPLNPRDDVTDTRSNNDSAAESFLGRAGANVGGWRMDLVQSVFHKQGGLAGWDYNQASDARWSTLHHLSAAVVRTVEPIARRLEVEFEADFVHSQDGFEDQLGELGLGLHDDIGFSWKGGGYGKTALDLHEIRQLLTLLVGGSAEQFRQHYGFPMPESGPEQNRYGLAIAAEDRIRVIDPFLEVVPGVHYERYRNDFKVDPHFAWSQGAQDDSGSLDLVSPTAGLVVRPLDWLALKGNFGITHRPPSLSELFGERGAVVGNSALRPERNLQWDAGFDVFHPFPDEPFRLRLEAAYFENRLENLILFVRHSQTTSQAENIGQALIRGVETSLSMSFSELARLNGSYTFQRTEDESDVPYWRGHRLPGRPEHELDLRPSIQPIDELEIFYEICFVSGNYLDRANLYLAPERSIHNAGIKGYFQARPDLRLTATFEIKNLTDSRVYDILRYPLPGRGYFFTLSMNVG